MIENAPNLDDLKRSAKAGDLGALQRLRDIGFFEQKKNGPAAGYPASHAQLRLWLLDRIDPGLAVYNMPAAVALDGALDESAFAAAFDALIRRHETLRTTFM